MKVRLMPNSKAAELLKDKSTQHLAKRLTDYCLKAEACHYDHLTLLKLREQYKDVL